jgi:hypothetical protein
VPKPQFPNRRKVKRNCLPNACRTVGFADLFLIVSVWESR